MSDQMQATGWAKLRQVVIATTEHAADTAALREAFGLGPGFDDPELKALALLDATMPVSVERYLEVIGPENDSALVAAWLTKVGGRGGYVLSVQHPDPAGVRARAGALGVRVPVDTEAFGKIVLQLHPKDVGLVLEVDGIADPAEWFWDDINPGPEADASISDIVGVEVPVADPSAMTALWRELLGLGEPARPDEVDLSGSYVRFTAGGPSANWTVLVRRASPDASDPSLPGITFQLV